MQRRDKNSLQKQFYFFKRNFFKSSVIWFVAALFLLALHSQGNLNHQKISACEAMAACLMDGGYYLWNTAVPVIDSVLYLLLMALGNVLPVEELCCDFHSWAFNVEFNDKYEKLTAVFVPQTHYTHSCRAKTILEARMVESISESKINRKIFPFWHRHALYHLYLVNTQTLIASIQVFKS